MKPSRFFMAQMFKFGHSLNQSALPVYVEADLIASGSHTSIFLTGHVVQDVITYIVSSGRLYNVIH
jgi:hypothetical protein